MIPKIYLFLLGLLASLPLMAQDTTSTSVTPEDGMKAYSDARYVEATEIFEKAIANSPKPTDELYYNLGASYYKQGEYALALLNFQRAYRLDPSDNDIRHNIQVTRTKTIDKMEPQATFFMHRWIENMTHWFGLGGWMIVGLLFFVLFIAGFLLYFLSHKRDLRLAGFYCGIVSLLLCIWANTMLYRSHLFINDTSEAVVTSEVVTVKSSPDLSSEDVMVVHAGMEIKVLQKIGALSEVKFPDGSQGWIANSTYQLINNF